MKKLIMFAMLFGLLSLSGIAQADPINVALTGVATQSSTWSGWPAENANDGNTNGDPYNFNRALAHTWTPNLGWWQVDLLSPYVIDHIVIWNRTEYDGLPAYEELQSRLSNFKVSVIDSNGEVVWSEIVFPPDYPNPSMDFYLPNIEGQIVKIERLSQDYLWLAEVQVYHPVPEPATMFLLGFGLIGLAGYGRRKFKK